MSVSRVQVQGFQIPVDQLIHTKDPDESAIEMDFGFFCTPFFSLVGVASGRFLYILMRNQAFADGSLKSYGLVNVWPWGMIHDDTIVVISMRCGGAIFQTKPDSAGFSCFQ